MSRPLRPIKFFSFEPHVETLNDLACHSQVASVVRPVVGGPRWTCKWQALDPARHPRGNERSLAETLRQRGNRVVTNKQLMDHWSYACFLGSFGRHMKEERRSALPPKADIRAKEHQPRRPAGVVSAIKDRRSPSS